MFKTFYPIYVTNFNSKKGILKKNEKNWKFYKVFKKSFFMAFKVESPCKIRFISNEQYTYFA